MSIYFGYGMMGPAFGFGYPNSGSPFNYYNQMFGNPNLLVTKSGMRAQSAMVKFLQGTQTPQQRYQQAMTDYTNTAKPFYNGFYDKMENLKNSAQKLKNTSLNSVITPYGYSSDDEDIAKVVSGNLDGGANVTLKVNHLATAQQETYNQLLSNATGTFSGANTLAITTASGTTNFNFNFGANTTNSDAMKSIASQVNSAKTGVTANVMEKNGKSWIEFTSDKTGQQNAFNISMTGSMAGSLNAATSNAQDASYEVNGVAYTSSSNKIKIPGPSNSSLSVQLNGTGTAHLNRNQLNSDDIVDAMKDFANSYNKVVDYLHDNSSLSSAIDTMAFSFSILKFASHGLGSIGIMVDNKGRISLDSDKFKSAFQSNPQKVKKMIGDSNGLAGMTCSKASDAILNGHNLLKAPKRYETHYRYGNYYGQFTGSIFNSYG